MHGCRVLTDPLDVWLTMIKTKKHIYLNKETHILPNMHLHKQMFKSSYRAQHPSHDGVDEGDKCDDDDGDGHEGWEIGPSVHWQVQTGHSVIFRPSKDTSLQHAATGIQHFYITRQELTLSSLETGSTTDVVFRKHVWVGAEEYSLHIQYIFKTPIWEKDMGWRRCRFPCKMQTQNTKYR